MEAVGKSGVRLRQNCHVFGVAQCSRNSLCRNSDLLIASFWKPCLFSSPELYLLIPELNIKWTFSWNACFRPKVRKTWRAPGVNQPDLSRQEKSQPNPTTVACTRPRRTNGEAFVINFSWSAKFLLGVKNELQEVELLRLVYSWSAIFNFITLIKISSFSIIQFNCQFDLFFWSFLNFLLLLLNKF